MVIIYLVGKKSNVFNKLFSSVATDLQDKYFPLVNNQNRSSHKSSKNTFYFSPISGKYILTAIRDFKSKSSLDFSNIHMNIINKIQFYFISTYLHF